VILAAVQAAQCDGARVVPSVARGFPQARVDPGSHAQPFVFRQLRLYRRHGAIAQLHRHVAPESPVGLQILGGRSLQEIDAILRVRGIVAPCAILHQHRANRLGKIVAGRLLRQTACGKR